MTTLLGSFVRDERGTAAIECMFIAFLVAELVVEGLEALLRRLTIKREGASSV